MLQYKKAEKTKNEEKAITSSGGGNKQVKEVKEGNNRKPREGLNMRQTYRSRHI